MSIRILISNFAKETTAEELKAAFAEHEIDVEVSLNREGNADKVTAVVELPEDADRVTADRLAQRINGLEYKGRYLKAYVPLFM